MLQGAMTGDCSSVTGACKLTKVGSSSPRIQQGIVKNRPYLLIARGLGRSLEEKLGLDFPSSLAGRAGSVNQFCTQTEDLG